MNSNLSYNISPDFYSILKKSYYYYDLSNGQYDITIMPLVNLWGFGPDIFVSPPSEAMIDER